MITEETIGRTRFFHADDGADYMVRDVRTVKIVTLINCADSQLVDLILGDDICEQFMPVKVQFQPVDLPVSKIPLTTPDKQMIAFRKRLNKHTSAKHKVAADKPNKPGRKKSKYKGVRINPKPYADGRTRYEVNRYDPSAKKVKFLGCFDNELEAAAVYQEHAGNKEEAARLRALAKQDRADMAEQAENNPDRKKVKRQKVKGKSQKQDQSVADVSEVKMKEWLCCHCKIELRHPTMPTRCIQCDSASFKEIETES